MTTVRFIEGMEKLNGWPEVAKLLGPMMEEKGLGDWDVTIRPSPSPPKKHCYRAQIFREEKPPLKTFLVICPPIELDKLKTEAQMQADIILKECLSALKKEGKGPNPDRTKES